MTTPQPEYRTIPLTQGQVALVDESKYDFLMQWKWYAAWDKDVKSFYAQRNSDRTPDGYQRPIKMHRFILGLSFGNKLQADHKNHNTLDNRSGNLRIVEPHQNSINRKISSVNTSGHKGVHFHKAARCWIASIGIRRKKIHLGCFPSKELAIEAYLRAATIYHGEFARTK